MLQSGNRVVSPVFLPLQILIAFADNHTSKFFSAPVDDSNV